MEWPCPTCTFSNVAASKKCEICNEARPTAADATQSAQSSLPAGTQKQQNTSAAIKPPKVAQQKGKLSNASLGDLHRARMARGPTVNTSTPLPTAEAAKVTTYNKSSSASSSLKGFFGFGGGSSSKPKTSSQQPQRSKARMKTISDLPKPVRRG
mmetsp:Transcript_4849/g.7726  ORF Transcript_4849/g.7726 Transcript_4849/m.7726 type:complete len:154 (+) Transcript_4849:2-463(+)